ncbi:uncharacterized protein LOC134266492 [Saccostrea cucullata]|uniref:uncharacterized protein LOC134266492 n=1 Tax=Saccostrea cuccullata TaxID=36930 RepID=UPI002ED3A90D
MWEQQKMAYVNSAEEVLGYRKGKRRKTKQSRKVREEDKRRWMAEKAERAQKAAENGRQKELYSIVKQLTRKSNKQTAVVKSKDGELLKNKGARLARWREHFEEVLNRDTPESPPQDEHDEGEELDISVEPPTTQEIRTALKKLRNGKRGNLQDRSNWREVTLLPLASKAHTSIIINRIQAGVDRTLRNILEQVNEWNATLYIHFVDFEKAFDSVHRDNLWVIMKKYGIPRKLIMMVKALYDNFQCSVIDDNVTTDPFPVKQGCWMPGFLFLLVIDWVMQQSVRGMRTGIRWDFTTMLEDLDFADDIALLSSAMDHLQS